MTGRWCAILRLDDVAVRSAHAERHRPNQDGALLDAGNPEFLESERTGGAWFHGDCAHRSHESEGQCRNRTLGGECAAVYVEPVSESTTKIRVIVVMGVSGAGKTEVGRALADAIDWAFHDADEYHSKANIEKMHRGEGLTDADRAPWLAKLRALVTDVIASNQRVVLACSALKESYRDMLRAPNTGTEETRFVYLDVPRAVLEERLRTRHGHFAPPALLESQLATLEPPSDALWVDGTKSPPEIVRSIRAELRV